MRFRLLSSVEISLAQTVFGQTIPYDRIYISDLDLGDPVTAGDMFVFRRGHKIVTEDRYCICWRKGFNTAALNLRTKSVFIHELTHVWQGVHGIYPAVYMASSALDQLTHGISDIIKRRQWRGWGTHRSTAYNIEPNEIGENWNRFNTEQQCNLIQSWYTDRATWKDLYDRSSITGGNASRDDPRYPYIRDVIRAQNKGAYYKALSLPAGGDAEIKRIQDRLVFLGYLKQQYADGILGRTKSATLDAVAAFQRRNGLTVDRDLGGPNSNTRRKLMGNVKFLVRAL